METIPFTDFRDIEELEEIIVRQSKAILEKEKLIEELTKENSAYKEAVRKWREEQDKTYWG